MQYAKTLLACCLQRFNSLHQISHNSYLALNCRKASQKLSSKTRVRFFPCKFVFSRSPSPWLLSVQFCDFVVKINAPNHIISIDSQPRINRYCYILGVCRFPKTCLHSIISLLNRDIDSPSGPSCISETPKLAELMYQLIYFLCAHSETGTPCQRYLRTSHDFFVSHASKLPFVRPSLLEDGDEELFVLLSNQQSWLLKTIAIEIKMASQTRLRSSMVRILDVLYGQQTAQSNEFTQSLRGMLFSS